MWSWIQFILGITFISIILYTGFGEYFNANLDYRKLFWIETCVVIMIGLIGIKQSWNEKCYYEDKID